VSIFAFGDVALVKIGNCIQRDTLRVTFCWTLISVRQILLHSKDILLRFPNFGNMATMWDSCIEDIWENVVPVHTSWQKDQALASEKNIQLTWALDARLIPYFALRNHNFTHPFEKDENKFSLLPLYNWEHLNIWLSTDNTLVSLGSVKHHAQWFQSFVIIHNLLWEPCSVI
jgi:hypothetical protein